MTEINWTPANIFAYRDKPLKSKGGAMFTITTNGRGIWEAHLSAVIYNVLEFFSVIDCCAWLNQMGAQEDA
jgi:hypothetical protein